MLTAEKIIDLFDLKQLPVEGGLFNQTYSSQEIVPDEALTEKCKGTPHHFGTAIFALMTPEPDCFSAMHTLPTDEIYHFYLGDPIEMLLLYPDETSRTILLGQDVLNEQYVQFVVPAGVWQGFHLLPGGKFGLIGTTMAPGFHFTDYLGGDRKSLIELYPQHRDLISALTRPSEPLRRSY